jgi:diamine N-acetyltransferase
MNTSSPHGPIVNFGGELVALGPMRREYLPLYLRWINDFNTAGNLAFQPSPVTHEQETTWFDRVATAEGQSHFTIFERASDRPIGNCGVQGISPLHRRAEVGIMIGEPAVRGKGYGTEAMRLLLDYAFTALNMHSVMLTVYEYNHPARRSYEKAGFQEIGRRREARWHNGRFWDEILMDILASDFESPVLRRVLDPGSDGN